MKMNKPTCSIGDPASQSTPIKWKEGMDLTKKALENMKGSDMKNRKRKFSQGDRTFFLWFLDNGDPSADDIAEVS